MPAVVSAPSPSRQPSSIWIAVLQAIGAVLFCLVCVGFESAARYLGFRAEAIPFPQVYWLLVTVMTVLGALLILTMIIMLVPFCLYFWMTVRYPSLWRQIREVNADRAELNDTSHSVIRLVGLTVGGLVLLWPVYRIWFMG
jgi:Ca2+/Na+ antiporter